MSHWYTEVEELAGRKGQKSRWHRLHRCESGCCLLTKLISFSSLLQEVQVCAVSVSFVLFWRINDNPLICMAGRKRGIVWCWFPAAGSCPVAKIQVALTESVDELALNLSLVVKRGQKSRRH